LQALTQGSTSTSASFSTKLTHIMRPLPYLFHCAVVFSHFSSVLATSSWSFDDATLSIQSKKAGVGGAQKDKYGNSRASSNVEIILTLSS
jgi:hypothetical protein